VEEELARAFLRLIWLEHKRFAQTLAAHSLTVPQFYALVMIWQQEAHCPMGSLATAMLQSSGTMTGIVDRLVRMGLVTRQTAAHDRRVVLVELTPRGREVVRHVYDDKVAELHHSLSHLGEEDQQALLRLIRTYLEVSRGGHPSCTTSSAFDRKENSL